MQQCQFSPDVDQFIFPSNPSVIYPRVSHGSFILPAVKFLTGCWFTYVLSVFSRGSTCWPRIALWSLLTCFSSLLTNWAPCCVTCAEIPSKFLKVPKSPPSCSVSHFPTHLWEVFIILPKPKVSFPFQKFNIPHIYRILDFSNLSCTLHLVLLHVIRTHVSSLLPAPWLSQSNLTHWVSPQTGKWATCSSVALV